MKPQPKTLDIIIEPYRAWIRTLPCWLSGEDCNGVIVGHHVQRRSIVTDDLTMIPLCMLHHSRIHGGGLRTRDWEWGQVPFMLAKLVEDAPIEVLQAIVDARREREKARIW